MAWYRPFYALACCGGLAAALNAACHRPGELMPKPAAAADIGKKVKVLVATTQRSTTDQLPSTGRAAVLSYEEYTISVPLTTSSARSRPPPPIRQNFVVTKATSRTKPVSTPIFSTTVASGDAVFVRLRTTIRKASSVSAALDRQPVSGEIVGFSWPPRGTLTGYVADREQRTFLAGLSETFLNISPAPRR